VKIIKSIKRWYYRLRLKEAEKNSFKEDEIKKWIRKIVNA